MEKPLCKYGLACYQKNPEHKKQYRHPSSVPSKDTNKLKPEGEDDTSISPKRLKAVSPKNPKGCSPRNTRTSTPRKTKDTIELKPEGEDDTSISPKKFRAVSPKNLKGSSPKKTRASIPRKTKTNDTSAPASLKDLKEDIKEKFLVYMPQDFFDFWNFCKMIKADDPAEAFSDIGLHLVGPYDVVSGMLNNSDVSEDNILCHWRYYYDPPEFQTVIKKDGDDFCHIGYFRDDPSEMPSAVCSNCASKGCCIKLEGDNIFAAINSELTNAIKKNSKDIKGKLENIRKDLQKLAKEKKYSLTTETAKTKERQKKVMGKTFHGFGIVVPFDKKTEVGYRSLPETDAKLKSLLTRIVKCESEESRLRVREPFDEILTNLQFANDECDYGMGLELGIDLFCFGEPYFHSDVQHILCLAYKLLNRPVYEQIIIAHLKNRRKGDQLSIIS